MGTVEVFGSISNFMTTFLAFVLLSTISVYAIKGMKLSRGLWLLFIGLSIEFISSWVGYKSVEYYDQGMSAGLLAFVELGLILASVIFFALAASQILVINVPDILIALAVLFMGLFGIVFFVFISPNGVMVNNMRYIFPIVGFLYISIAFFTQTGSKYRMGFMVAAVLNLIVAMSVLLRLFGFPYLVAEAWYIPAAYYVGMSISFLLVKNDVIISILSTKDAEIAKYNQRLKDIIKSSPFPIIISKLTDDKIILANNNAVKLFGIYEAEIEHYRLRDFFADPENRQHLRERLEQEKEVQDFEILVKTPMGEAPFWLLASANIIDYDYDIAIYTAFQDITSRKNREVMLKDQATRDPLTSLYNRRYFEEEVAKRIAKAKTDGSSYSVFMVDADKFKRVNDTYGHKIGDKVLIELANACEKGVRPEDVVARYGGEEFVVFLSNADAEKAYTVAERLRQSVSAITVMSDNDEPINFTISIGLSSSIISDNIDTLVKTADDALYRAKNNGRNRCEIFKPEDLKHFQAKEETEEQKESHIHPVFNKENHEEISLLDGGNR